MTSSIVYVASSSYRQRFLRGWHTFQTTLSQMSIPMGMVYTQCRYTYEYILNRGMKITFTTLWWVIYVCAIHNDDTHSAESLKCIEKNHPLTFFQSLAGFDSYTDLSTRCSTRLINVDRYPQVQPFSGRISNCLTTKFTTWRTTELKMTLV